jgi:hypothetical protein
MSQPRIGLIKPLLIIVALLVSLAACATPDVGRVVVAPRQELTLPAMLQLPPPKADFQERLRSFFLPSPPMQTGPQSTP